MNDHCQLPILLEHGAQVPSAADSAAQPRGTVQSPGSCSHSAQYTPGVLHQHLRLSTITVLSSLLPLCWTAFLGSLRMFIPFSHSKWNFPMVTISCLLCLLVFPWFVKQNIDGSNLEDRVYIIFAESRLFLRFQMPICHFTCLGQHLLHFSNVLFEKGELSIMSAPMYIM